MNPISQVQQDMLGRMEQLKSLSEATPIKPAQAFAVQPGEAGFAAAFDHAVRAVDAQQHRSGKLMAEALRGQAERFDLMAALPTPRFPGGAALRWLGRGWGARPHGMGPVRAPAWCAACWRCRTRSAKRYSGPNTTTTGPPPRRRVAPRSVTLRQNTRVSMPRPQLGPSANHRRFRGRDRPRACAGRSETRAYRTIAPPPFLLNAGEEDHAP